MEGRDLIQKSACWCGLDSVLYRVLAHGCGPLGEMSEVASGADRTFVLSKPGLAATPLETRGQFGK